MLNGRDEIAGHNKDRFVIIMPGGRDAGGQLQFVVQNVIDLTPRNETNRVAVGMFGITLLRRYRG